MCQASVHFDVHLKHTQKVLSKACLYFFVCVKFKSQHECYNIPGCRGALNCPDSLTDMYASKSYPTSFKRRL